MTSQTRKRDARDAALEAVHGYLMELAAGGDAMADGLAAMIRETIGLKLAANMTLGQMIRHDRKSRGITLANAAARMGWRSPTTWHAYEQGRTPRHGTLAQMAAAIGADGSKWLAAACRQRE